MPKEQHDAALAKGLIRYCPICDGYEVTDKNIGVIGTGDHGMREALFLRGFSKDVTLIAPGAAHDLDDACRAKLNAAGIEHLDGPCTPIGVDGDTIGVMTPTASACSTRSIRRWDRVSAPNSRSRPARGRPRTAASRSMPISAHRSPALFAAGDVVKGLDQISHAMGEAGVAATTIRNLLDERAPLRR